MSGRSKTPPSSSERSEVARRAARARWATDRAAALAGAEPGLQTAEQRYRALVEQIPAVVSVDALDEDGTTVYISPQVEDLLGYSPQEWSANPGIWFESLHPDNQDEVWQEYLRRRDEDQDWSMEYRMVAKDGHTVWIREDDTILRDAGGKPTAVQSVMIDITKQKDLEERLRFLHRTKDALLHAVSHDLRGSLSAVLGASLLMIQIEDLPGEDREKLLRGIASSAKKMDRMVADLLDLDRVDRGLIQPRRERTDLLALAHRVVDEMQVPQDRSVLVEGRPVEADVDVALVERMVENLVANGVKFTSTGSPVWVRIRGFGEVAEIIVEDAGPGVPEEQRLTIFHPFERGATDETITGVGIGLSLVATFSELHGGRAWVGEREGGGAAFHIELPMTEPA